MDGDLDSSGLSKEDIYHHMVRSPEPLSAVGQSDGPVASESQLLSIFLLGHLVCVCVCACKLSRVQLFATPWTVACQASLSMGFFKQEYWSGVPFLSPGDLFDPGVKPGSPALAGEFFTA